VSSTGGANGAGSGPTARAGNDSDPVVATTNKSQATCLNIRTIRLRFDQPMAATSKVENTSKDCTNSHPLCNLATHSSDHPAHHGSSAISDARAVGTRPCQSVRSCNLAAIWSKTASLPGRPIS
jgi:hypothetical protein